jgi:hypothetical protein
VGSHSSARTGAAEVSCLPGAREKPCGAKESKMLRAAAEQSGFSEGSTKKFSSHFLSAGLAESAALIYNHSFS